MTENSELGALEGAHANSRKTQIIPVAVLCGVVLAVALNAARGKNNETFNGVMVMDYPAYTFYPDQKGCQPRGTAYWLVPGGKFQTEMPMPATSDSAHLDRIFHASWRVTLRGNLSSIGSYGLQRKYWRQLDVLYVINATQLNCTADNGSGSE